MGKDICPFLTREEKQERECIQEKCFIYDAENKSCVFASLSGNITADYKQIINAISKNGADNGKLIKKIGGMMNKTYKPLMEFLENTDKGKSLISPLETSGEGNTAILKEILEAIRTDGPGQEPRGTEDYSGVLEQIRDNVEKQYERTVEISAAGEVLENIRKLNGEILEKLDSLGGPESSDEGFKDTIKLLLDTLKKPLAASLKIQQDISHLAVSIGDDLKSGTEKITALMENQARKLDERAEESNTRLDTLPDRDFISSLMASASEPVIEIRDGISSIKEGVQVISRGLDNVSASMAELAESQTRLNKSFTESMELFSRFIEVQEHYFENEETSLTLKRADKLNNAGLSLLMSGDYDGAVEYFKDSLRLNSSLWGAYSNMGLAFSEKGEKEKAAAVFKKLIAMNPDFTEGYYNLGMVLFEENEGEKAVELFKKTIEKNPDFSKAYVALGDALFESESYESALSAWKKALAIDPTLDEVRDNQK